MRPVVTYIDTESFANGQPTRVTVSMQRLPDDEPMIAASLRDVPADFCDALREALWLAPTNMNTADVASPRPVENNEPPEDGPLEGDPR